MIRPQAYEGVAVACPVTVRYERKSDRPALWFAGRALRALLDTAGIPKDAVDGLAMVSFSMGPDTTIAATEHFGLSPRWIEWLPTGGASGVMAVRRAARAVQAGDADIVACIAADTSQGNAFRDLVRNFSTFSSDAIYPHGAAGPNAPFALITDHYMRLSGATREDFGHIAVAQRANAFANPNALLGSKPLDIATYM